LKSSLLDRKKTARMVKAPGGPAPTGSRGPGKPYVAVGVLQHQKLTGPDFSHGTRSGPMDHLPDQVLLAQAGGVRIVPFGGTTPPPSKTGQTIQAGELHGGENNQRVFN
jgi:hypothetical protein